MNALDMILPAPGDAMDACAVSMDCDSSYRSDNTAALYCRVENGCIFGNRYKSSAETAGGLVLIFMGAKILITHLCA